MMFKHTALVMALVWALLPVFAQAGLFDDDEARKQIAQMRQQNEQQMRLLDARLAELENTMRSRSVVDLFNQVEQIKSEVSKLRGQQEVQANELENAQKRQRDLYIDVDGRMRKLEAQSQQLLEQNKALQEQLKSLTAASAPPSALSPSSGVASSTPTQTAQTTPPGQTATLLSTNNLTIASQPVPAPIDLAAEQRAYDAAFNEFRQGRYTEAATGFLTFLKNYPRSALAPSAQYWVGNSLFGRKDFRGAIREQSILINQYPDASKVPDAMLNIASSHRELGESKEERRVLEALIAKYPTTEAAARAKQRLR
ncbi:MAG: hypothetical protein RLZZ502_106 [Pseudomonadota bacterium]|jgi:tol-pal system protein YbgF